MSIFGSIVSKIFGHANAAPAATPTAPSAAPLPGSTVSFNNPPPAPPPPAQSNASPSSPVPTPTASTAAPVDVEAVLTEMAGRNAQKLDWRRSIVDLMKLLDLDSSLSARQGLARELHYAGSMDDSASMNIWLHKEVMQKLAANGGKVPDDLK